MNAWLKGGLIGAGIGILINILLLIVTFIFKSQAGLYFIFLPCVKIFSLKGDSGMACLFIGPIINFILLIILGFIMGSIVGIIIGKIKSKK